jgi:hypothetical protein
MIVIQNRLTARLKSWHRDADGNLALEGTPALVLGIKDGMVVVRALAYAYPAERELQCKENDWKWDVPDVHHGMLLSLNPGDLVFDTFETRTLRPDA